MTPENKLSILSDPHALLHSDRGNYLIAKALHFAIKHMGSLPKERERASGRAEMLAILNGCFPTYAMMLREQDIFRAKLEWKKS
jgi:hypothetical protein